MKVLVTGASGFLGRRLVAAVAKLGPVVAVYRTAAGTADTATATAELSDRTQVQRVFEEHKPDVVLHAAARIPQSANEDVFTFFNDNVVATLNVYECARAAGIPRIVLSSSMSVYGPPQSLPVTELHPVVPDLPYALSKIGCELFGRYFASSGLETTVLRYSGIFGAGQRSGAVPAFIARSLQNAPMTLNAGGRPSSDFVWVQDVVQANLLALQHTPADKFEIFNIGSGEEFSILQLAETIRRLTGSRSEITPVEGPAPRNFRFSYDISKARRNLGFQPTLVETALRECIRQKREGLF